ATLGAAPSAADAVLTGATQFPTETANAGILPRDIAELQKLRDDLIQTDRNQEGAKGERTGGTASKNSLLGGLTSQVDQIFAAAALEFAHEPLTVSLPG
ncbi:MAG: hypothetical protein HYY76_00870, partial [Acidobacteria bacterium]|nr:hypothetical protein [Acidobacteriota bacterium]